MEDIAIEPLARRHVRKGFKCGRPRIDNFLINNAREQHERYQVRVFVTCAEDSRTVLDAATDELVKYYEKLGFQLFANGERRMFLPLATLRQL